MYRVTKSSECLISMSLMCYVTMGIPPRKLFKYVAVASTLASMLSFPGESHDFDLGGLYHMAIASGGLYLIAGAVDNFFCNDDS